MERGTLLTELGWTGPPRSVQLYRPVGTGLDPVTDMLGYADWVAVTGGYPWTRGHQQDRHNLLATELGLRVAEHCDVGAVLGESLSRHDLLSPGYAGDTANRCADLTLVRPDGMRIAVEITGSINREFARKADRWAELLAGTDPDSTGLAVVFVDAAPPDRGAQVAAEMRRAILAQVARAAHQVPGSAGRRVSERMAAVGWQSWFPASRTGSTAFTALQCVRPTGPAGDRWEPVRLLDPADLRAPAENHGDAAAVANCAALLGVPHWLRQRPPGRRLRPGPAPPRRHHDAAEDPVRRPRHQAPHPRPAHRQPAARAAAEGAGGVKRLGNQVAARRSAGTGNRCLSRTRPLGFTCRNRPTRMSCCSGRQGDSGQ